MIEWFMFGALGFFLGCLLALILAPPLWNRAVRLTTKRLEATMPMSLADIQADKDQIRAEYAVEIRKVEVALEKAKEKAARELIEANKRRVELQTLNAALEAAKGQIQEKDNANRVLEQTIKRRLPDLDERLKTAKKALAELETVNAELRSTIASQSEALKTARGTLHTQRADIDRLRAALEAGGGGTAMRSSRADSRYLAETQRLSAELSRVQEELKQAQASLEENALLRREMTNLAGQIFAATRGQEIRPQVAVEVAQAFTSFAETPSIPAPPPAWHGGNGEGRELRAEPPVDMADAAPAKAPEEKEFEEAVAAAEEPSPAEDAEESHALSEETPAAEPEAPPSKRLGRRRKRRATKGSGKTLSERLKGLVVDAP